MRGRKVPPKAGTSLPVSLPSAPLTLAAFRDATHPIPRYQVPMPAPTFTESERRAACEDVARRMYAAGMGWNLDAILKLTSAEIDLARRFVPFKMPEPTPAERGVLARYQDEK